MILYSPFFHIAIDKFRLKRIRLIGCFKSVIARFFTPLIFHFSRLLNESSVEELNNYIVWTVASSAEKFLPQRFRDALNNFRLVRLVSRVLPKGTREQSVQLHK